MTAYAFRPRILWMQGTEVRHATHSELFAREEIATFGEGLADALAENGAVTFETRRGDWHTIPARLITDVHYQRVELDGAHQPETLPTRTPGAQLPGHCCTDPSPCRDEAARAVQALPTAHEEDAAYDLAAQEARHPGLGRILNALVTQLPPDDPDKCAETLAAMDAAGPLQPDDIVLVMRNGARDCPCWPGQCTCDVKPAEPDPEHGGRDES